MEVRRLLNLQSSDDAEAYRRISRRIWKYLRHDIRIFNTKRIPNIIPKISRTSTCTRLVRLWNSLKKIRHRVKTVLRHLLKADGTPTLKVLQRLFNAVFLEGVTTEA
ncbi:unnamed protein product [Euphydryas editha]|uniref:Uncharacterized protein n=1 Tax=Euphydryas editha TaxID=104508 RepID=A0AAU9UI03_EUPED|nr:unnamed protein product [Euphydryas editha]